MRGSCWWTLEPCPDVDRTHRHTHAHARTLAVSTTLRRLVQWYTPGEVCNVRAESHGTQTYADSDVCMRVRTGWNGSTCSVNVVGIVNVVTAAVLASCSSHVDIVCLFCLQFLSLPLHVSIALPISLSLPLSLSMSLSLSLPGLVSVPSCDCTYTCCRQVVVGCFGVLRHPI